MLPQNVVQQIQVIFKNIFGSFYPLVLATIISGDVLCEFLLDFWLPFNAKLGLAIPLKFNFDIHLIQLSILLASVQHIALISKSICCLILLGKLEEYIYVYTIGYS